MSHPSADPDVNRDGKPDVDPDPDAEPKSEPEPNPGARALAESGPAGAGDHPGERGGSDLPYGAVESGDGAGQSPPCEWTHDDGRQCDIPAVYRVPHPATVTVEGPPPALPVCAVHLAVYAARHTEQYQRLFATDGVASPVERTATDRFVALHAVPVYVTADDLRAGTADPPGDGTDTYRRVGVDGRGFAHYLGSADADGRRPVAVADRRDAVRQVLAVDTDPGSAGDYLRAVAEDRGWLAVDEALFDFGGDGAAGRDDPANSPGADAADGGPLDGAADEGRSADDAPDEPTDEAAHSRAAGGSRG